MVSAILPQLRFPTALWWETLADTPARRATDSVSWTLSESRFPWFRMWEV